MKIKITKKQLYEAMINEFIKTENYENCERLKQQLDHPEYIDEEFEVDIDENDWADEYAKKKGEE